MLLIQCMYRAMRPNSYKFLHVHAIPCYTKIVPQKSLKTKT
jgi:hypothetical protein